MYFRSLDEELRSGHAAPSIDWFAIGEAWNRGTQRYGAEPQGDALTIAARVADELKIAP
jgi:alpha-N-acetylglucosaminidase